MKRGKATTSAISPIWENSRTIIRIGKLRADWTPFSKKLLRRNANSWRGPRRNKPRKARILGDVRMKCVSVFNSSAKKSTGDGQNRKLSRQRSNENSWRHIEQ